MQDFDFFAFRSTTIRFCAQNSDLKSVSSLVVVIVVVRRPYLLSSHVSTLAHRISTFYCTYISFLLYIIRK